MRDAQLMGVAVAFVDRLGSEFQAAEAAEARALKRVTRCTQPDHKRARAALDEATSVKLAAQRRLRLAVAFLEGRLRDGPLEVELERLEAMRWSGVVSRLGLTHVLCCPLYSNDHSLVSVVEAIYSVWCGLPERWRWSSAIAAAYAEQAAAA
jgi:hypothetical protein